MLSLDELSSTPVDAESRMSIVDVYCPTENEIKPILPELTAHKVDDFINMIKHQGDLYKNGVEFSNTLMLYGVPGCGKSTVAKYIAQQIGLPLVIARLDALVSSLLGSTSKNIRKVFDFADSRPCILFLDEFDAIAFGCPAMGAEVLEEEEFQPMFDACEGKLGGKKIALFGSYGWGDGEWMRNWEERCRNAGALLACDPVIANEAPDAEAEENLRKAAEALIA